MGDNAQFCHHSKDEIVSHLGVEGTPSSVVNRSLPKQPTMHGR
jgi:hypothetical protein